MKKNIIRAKISPAIVTSYKYFTLITTEDRNVSKENKTACIRKFPKTTVEEYWLKISLLFSFNVVHEHKLILPIKCRENWPCVP